MSPNWLAKWPPRFFWAAMLCAWAAGVMFPQAQAKRPAPSPAAVTDGDQPSAAATPPTVVFYPPLGLPGLHIVQEGLPPVGLYPDLIRAIADAAKIKAEIRSAPWPEPLDAIRAGRGDVLGPIMGQPSSFPDLQHTQALMRVEWARYVRTGESRSDFALVFHGIRVAVLSDSVGTRWLAREHPSAIQVNVESIEDGLRALAAGQADALLALKLPARVLIERDWPGRIEEAGTELTAPMSLAVSPQSAALLPLLNAAIEKLTESGDVERLRNRWMARLPSTSAEMAEARQAKLLAVMVAVLLLLSAVLWVWNLRLSLARRQADEARVAKSNFLAVMSHEIRTPINGLVNLIDLLQRSRTTPEQASLLQQAEQANRSLLTLVNQVLDYSKIEALQMEITPHPMRLESLMQRVQAVLSAQPRPAEVVLQFDELPAGLPVLMADEQRVSQVLINLGGNALKFTQQGTVRISVQTLSPQRDARGHWRLRLEVQDTGPGIPANEIGRLFKPFVQLKTGLDRPHAGTGLGLSTSAELVRQMGGELRVSSEPGRLTRFWFDLTLAPAPAPEQSPEPASAVSQAASLPVAARRRVVLVVDDNPLNLLVTRKILEQEGYEIRQAASATVALAMVQQPDAELPDLILMDLHMPELDGVEAMRRMRQALGKRLPPVMAVTGAVTEDARLAAREAGMVGFLPKPFDRKSLLAAVAALQNH